MQRLCMTRAETFSRVAIPACPLAPPNGGYSYLLTHLLIKSTTRAREEGRGEEGRGREGGRPAVNPITGGARDRHDTREETFTVQRRMDGRTRNDDEESGEV